jgi:hypothetical protein
MGMSLAGKPISAYRPRARELSWRPLIGRIEKPPLWEFVLLSLLLHILVIFLFGAPPGGSSQGRAMWGTLDVVILGYTPPAAPILKLDRTPLVPAPAPAPPQPRPRPFTPAPVAAPPAPPPSETERVVVPPLMDRLPTLEKRLELPPTFTVPPPTEIQAPAPLPTEAKPPAPAPLTPPQNIAPPPQPVQRAPVEAPIATPPMLQPMAPAQIRERAEVPQLELPRIETPRIRESVEVPQMQIPRMETPVVPALPETPNVMIPVPEPSRSTIAPVAAPPSIVAPPVQQAPATAPAVPTTTPVEAAPAAPTQAPTVTPRIETQRVEPGSAPRQAAPREAPPAPRAAPTPAPAPAETPGTESPFRRPAPVETPPDYDPFSTPAPKNIDVDAMRSRAASLARKGSGQSALFAFPMPPVPEKKSKLEDALDKAHKPDCRTAYQGLGLAAVVPLVANEFGEGTCKW